MGMIGIDPNETADHLDRKAEWDAADLMRKMARRIEDLESREAGDERAGHLMAERIHIAITHDELVNFLNDIVVTRDATEDTIRVHDVLVDAEAQAVAQSTEDDTPNPPYDLPDGETSDSWKGHGA